MSKKPTPGPNDGIRYELCQHCDHFIDDNTAGINIDDVAEMTPTVVTLRSPDGGTYTQCRYVHLDNGEKDHDHDATPSGIIHTLAEWKKEQPDLFKKHKDGEIGPNSVHHVMRREVEKAKPTHQVLEDDSKVAMQGSAQECRSWVQRHNRKVVANGGAPPFTVEAIKVKLLPTTQRAKLAVMIEGSGLDMVLDTIVRIAEDRDQIINEGHQDLGDIQSSMSREEAINQMEALFAQVKNLDPAPL